LAYSTNVTLVDSGGDNLLRPTEIATIIGTTFGALAVVVAIIFGINQWRRFQRRRNFKLMY
jgi:hypothetical protein